MDKNVQIEIEQYLRNELNSEERLNFTKKMEEDPLLKEEVALQQSLFYFLGNETNTIDDNPVDKAEVKKIRSLLKSEEYKKIAANINDNTNKYLEQEKKNTRKKNIFRSAAAIAAVFIIFLALTPLFKNNNSQQYYKDYAQWDNIPSFVEKGTAQSTLIEIEKFYNSKEYTKVIEMTNSLSKEARGNNPTLSIYLGASYFHNNDYDNAINTFDQFAKSNAYDSSKGNWYKVLVYLKQDRLEDVKNELDIITSISTNYNYEKAFELLKKLEE